MSCALFAHKKPPKNRWRGGQNLRQLEDGGSEVAVVLVSLGRPAGAVLPHDAAHDVHQPAQLQFCGHHSSHWYAWRAVCQLITTRCCVTANWFVKWNKKYGLDNR